MREIKVGDTVTAGQFLLFTSGEYSSYGVTGLYRAKVDFVIPAHPTAKWYTVTGEARPAPDCRAITLNTDWVDEVDCGEVHDESW